jgi:hypothetical protein
VLKSRSDRIRLGGSLHLGRVCEAVGRVSDIPRAGSMGSVGGPMPFAETAEHTKVFDRRMVLRLIVPYLGRPSSSILVGCVRPSVV